MLRSLKEVEGYMVLAANGDVGHVVDFQFDDDYWTVRYLVVETGEFFGGRRILISPISFRRIDWTARHFQLSLALDEVQGCPDIDLHQRVSRQQERDYNQYFRYPYYWEFSGLWGMGAYPGLLTPGMQHGPPAAHSDQSDDVHLRSAKGFFGFNVHGRDETLGQVEDFIVDDESWTIRYLSIDSGNWSWVKKALLAPNWADQVSWTERQVHVDVPRQAIKDCPEWKPTTAVHRDYEAHLYRYYGRPVYWDSTGRALAPPAAFHAGDHAG